MKLFASCIEEKNFHNAWAIAIRTVLKNGTELVIGGGEERKPIRDSCMLISMTGNAIKQIEDKELHSQFPFKRIDEYCNEFTRGFLKEYLKRPQEQTFAYLYFQRLVRHEGYLANIYDQLKWMQDELGSQIEHNITSNRIQAITWNLDWDTMSNSPPCLQRIQIRYIPHGNVDVHLTWRSRDLYAAWQPNVICIIDMLNREVIIPNGCKIVRIVDYCDSLHVYETDVQQAELVKLVPVSPQEMQV